MAQDFLVAVDVAQERLERPHPLPQPLGDVRPFLAAEHVRQHVAGPGFAPGSVVLGKIERDAQLAHRRFHALVDPLQFIARQTG